MDHNTMIAIVAVCVIVGCLAAGWLAEDIRLRRERAEQAVRDAVNADVDAYIQGLK